MYSNVKCVVVFVILMLLTFLVTLNTQKELSLPQIKNLLHFTRNISSAMDKTELERKFNHTNKTEQERKVNVTNCHPRKLSFLNASHPNFKSQVCLVSYPGSGNTWLRHLIQEATGFYTGSMYYDKILFLNGFRGEKKFVSAGDCIVYKTHFFRSKEIEQCKKIVMLMRNPFDTLVAFFHFSYVKGPKNDHTARINDDQFNTSNWSNFVKGTIKTLEKFVWLCTNVFQGPLHLVFYEDLKTDVMKAMDEVVEFLHLKPNTKDLLCMYKNREGQHHRKAENESKLHGIYSTMDEENIKTRIQRVASMIKQRLPERNIDVLLHYSNQYDM